MTENPFLLLPAVAEFAAKPEAILVHNPIAAGAFRLFDSIIDDTRLEEEALFRYRPDHAMYASQHYAFVATIASHVRHVIYLSDVISDEPEFRFSVDNPNQVFTRDSVITLPWLPGVYFRSRLKPSLRRIESETTSAALARLGLREIVRLPDSIFS
jgi:N-dimethylarginine dimethylaminohydrolase